MGFGDPNLLLAFVLSVLVVGSVRIVWVSSMLELFQIYVLFVQKIRVLVFGPFPCSSFRSSFYCWFDEYVERMSLWCLCPGRGLVFRSYCWGRCDLWVGLVMWCCTLFRWWYKSLYEVNV